MKVQSSAKITRKAVEMDGAKDVSIRWLISKDDGAPNFAMRLFEVQPGGHTPLHTHPHEHEVFVLEGRGIATDKGRDRPIGPEDVIFVPGGAEHNFRNTGDSVLRFLCLVPMSAC